MALREPLPAPFLRAAQGLADGSGRTLVIAGPEGSGKSALLEVLVGELMRRGVAVRSGRGAYRDRQSPFSAIGSLTDAAPEDSSSDDASSEPIGSSDDDALVPPIPGVGFLADAPAPTRRARGERQKGHVMGVTYAMRGRGVARIEPREYWEDLLRNLSPGRGIALALEDGAYIDPESRDLLLFLSERVRLRPVLLVLVLDSSDPSFGAWEERLLGRHDVDWVRTTSSEIDPREAARVKRSFDALPLVARQIVTTTCLMGGVVSEVHLARVSRLTFSELADALLPATEARLVRVEPGRVIVPHQPSIAYIPHLSSAAVVRELHREIAEALEALHPEPSLARRRELADHFFAWEAGPVALRYLLESAELSAQLLDYDAVDDLLTRALQCVPALPAEDRGVAETELRLFRARALLMAGRAAEAEVALREGVDTGLREGLSDDRFEEWLEPLAPALEAAGPRPELVSELAELADRLDASGHYGLASILDLIVVEDEVARGRYLAARYAAHRAGQLARRQPTTAPLVPLALMAVGLVRSVGTPDDQASAERYFHSASLALGPQRRAELEQIAVELRCRLLQLRGKRDAALELHQQSIGVAQRMRSPTLEAIHQLGVAELSLDRGSSARAEKALRRARELVDRAHLNPPALALLWLWLLEGRQAAESDDLSDARDRWEAIAALPRAGAFRRLRGEAMLRQAALDLLHGREEAALAGFGRPEVAAMFPQELSDASARAAHVRRLGTQARSGAAPLDLLRGRPTGS